MEIMQQETGEIAWGTSGLAKTRSLQSLSQLSAPGEREYNDHTPVQANQRIYPLSPLLYPASARLTLSHSRCLSGASRRFCFRHPLPFSCSLHKRQRASRHPRDQYVTICDSVTYCSRTNRSRFADYFAAIHAILCVERCE